MQNHYITQQQVPNTPPEVRTQNNPLQLAWYDCSLPVGEPDKPDGLYRQLTELSPDAIMVCCEGRIVLINPAGARLLGAAGPEVLIGTPLMQQVHPDYREAIGGRIRQVLEQWRPLVLFR